MMTALQRKLFRDAARLWAQLLASAVVMACGIATLTMSLSTLSSLQAARTRYYDQYRFPHVFAHLKRAPNQLIELIADIPGVARAQARIMVEVNLNVQGLAEPAVGRLISIPPHAPFGISELHIRRGRLPLRGRDNEVVASEAFVEAHRLRLGATIDAVINGRLESLRIIGVALSPEYIYQVRPGAVLPDDRRFGVFWMNNDDLAPAFDLDGAFNDVLIVLMPGASEAEVIEQVDRLTARYGGQGAYGRSDQTSDQFLSNELDQLRAMAILPPCIFLSATAFILNIVFSRVVRTQREQIAVLKAFGYRRLNIAAHYLGMALLTMGVGCALGIAAGWYLGFQLTETYASYFRFPRFEFVLDAGAVMIAVAAAGGGAMLGTLGSVRHAVSLPPAEAMRPEMPPDYRATILERTRLQHWFSPLGRMVLRHLERRPMRALFTTFGISLALAVLIVGSFMQGAMNYLIEFMFFKSQRQDVTVTLVDTASPDALNELANAPGVLVCEPFRAVPTRIRAGHRARLQGLIGLPSYQELYRVIDDSGRALTLPSEGLVLTDMLADSLGVRAGDRVILEVLSGQRPIVELPVATVVQSYVGTAAYMNIDALRRLMREDKVISGAFLAVDDHAADDLYHALKSTPKVASVEVKRAALDSFEDTIAENILRMRLYNIAFASIIAFGVIYNSARIALAERAHELATMRVLGFTRVECSIVLLGELAALTLAAIPIGIILGTQLARIITAALAGETVRIPFVIESSTYGFAVATILIAAIVSGLIVRRGVDRLDLIEVLKTKA